MRIFGAQQFSLICYERAFSVYSAAGDPSFKEGSIAYCLEHLDPAGQTCDHVGTFENDEQAWVAAAEHARAFEVSGYCDGTILIRFARYGGKIHQGSIFSAAATCGIKFTGEALVHRVPGDGKDRTLITCYWCRL